MSFLYQDSAAFCGLPNLGTFFPWIWGYPSLRCIYKKRRMAIFYDVCCEPCFWWWNVWNNVVQVALHLLVKLTNIECLKWFLHVNWCTLGGFGSKNDCIGHWWILNPSGEWKNPFIPSYEGAGCGGLPPATNTPRDSWWIFRDVPQKSSRGKWKKKRQTWNN